MKETLQVSLSDGCTCTIIMDVSQTVWKNKSNGCS